MEIQITQILMKKKKFNHYQFQLETQIVLSVANGKNKIIDIRYQINHFFCRFSTFFDHDNEEWHYEDVVKDEKSGKY